MGLRRPRDPGEVKRQAVKRWRLVFDTAGMPMQVVSIGRDPGDVDDAVRAFRTAVRTAMAAGGCRLVAVGVHIEGEACDHEVGG